MRIIENIFDTCDLQKPFKEVRTSKGMEKENFLKQLETEMKISKMSPYTLRNYLDFNRCLLEHCKKSLATYKLPAEFEFRKELPKTNVGKVLKKNFIDLAVRFIMDKPADSKLTDLIGYVGVKAPQFSYSRLKGADPISYVEMASTGEVGCIGTELHDAFLKALLSTGMKIPEKTILLAVSGDENRHKILDTVAELARQGYKFYGTEHTALFFQENGIDCTMVHKMHEKKSPNVSELINEKKLDLVISVPNPLKQIDLDLNYDLRRAAIDHSIPLITNLQVAKLFIESIQKKKFSDLEIRAWDEYI